MQVYLRLKTISLRLANRVRAMERRLARVILPGKYSVYYEFATPEQQAVYERFDWGRKLILHPQLRYLVDSRFYIGKIRSTMDDAYRSHKIATRPYTHQGRWVRRGRVLYIQQYETYCAEMQQYIENLVGYRAELNRCYLRLLENSWTMVDVDPDRYPTLEELMDCGIEYIFKPLLPAGRPAGQGKG